MVEIREGYENMDFAKVTEMLSKSYWAQGIQKDEVMKSAANSALVVGAFKDNEQIGYARVISDRRGLPTSWTFISTNRTEA